MKQDSVKNMTRGGQVILHNLRMINQVLTKVLLWTLPLGIIVFFFTFLLSTSPYQRYIGQQWGWAQFYLLISGEHHQQNFIQPNGNLIKVNSSQVIAAPFVKQAVAEISSKATRSFWISVATYLLTVVGVLIFLRKHGDAQSTPKRIKGDYLGTVSEAQKIMRVKSELSDLKMGSEKLPLPRYSEMQHYLFHGTTGSGKSTGIKELLDQIRQRGERAFIYDKSCNLVKQFYNPESDQLMNPFDVRGADWSLWKECRDKSEFENYAIAQIPMPLSTQDPFWINAARTIFAAAAFRMRKEKNPKILSLLKYLLTADINELQSLLKGTEAETLMSEKTEKTAISIKSVLATYLKSLCFIKDGDNPFSIREWVQNDQAQGWLFVSSLGNKHESVKPLITAWLDIGINELLSLPEISSRRIWIILDEVTSLNQLPYLSSGLSEARKFGGCFVIGLLSNAELAGVYGDKRGQAISSLLNTRFMFRVPDPDVAYWSAKNLGRITLEEVREGISYGANTMRDGISVNRVETEKPVITDSEIMRLNNLSCYVRLPGEYPITKIHFSYTDRPERNAPFIPREFEQDNLRTEIFDLAESIESTTSSVTIKNKSKKVSQKNNADISKATDHEISVKERVFE